MSTRTGHVRGGYKRNESDDDRTAVNAISSGASRNMEDVLLTRHDVRRALRRLPPIDRSIVVLMQRYGAPPGYHGPWPPTAAHVGEYLHATFPEFRKGPLPPRTVNHYNNQALGRMARWLTPKRVIR